MPFIQINTSIKSDVINDSLQKDISKMISDLTRKPETYVMTMIENNAKMTLIEKNMVYKILRKKINTLDELELVQKLVIQYNGIKEAELLIQKYYRDLMKDLDNFRICKYKEALVLLLDFLIHRDR